MHVERTSLSLSRQRTHDFLHGAPDFRAAFLPIADRFDRPDFAVGIAIEQQIAPLQTRGMRVRIRAEATAERVPRHEGEEQGKNSLTFDPQRAELELRARLVERGPDGRGLQSTDGEHCDHPSRSDG